MSTGAKVAIGVGVAIAAYPLLRPSTTTIMTAGGPVAVPPGGGAAAIASAFAARRDEEIARGMARGLTREAAAARVDRAAAMVGSMVAAATAARGTSGFGSYYRS